ncbi:MAG: hypothetical protein JXL84_24780 [Deltaproteobacteria bacterium]|nr:hypothetical protein [Deltaproteobacteria bacterium]
MKKGALLIVTVLLMLSSLSCDSPRVQERYLMPHVGTWVGLDRAGVKGTVVFGERGTGSMEFQNTHNKFQYVFDYSKQPVWLDLLYTREGRPFRAKLIVKFLDENRLQFYTFFDETRPPAFPDGKSVNLMTLTRVNRVKKG